MIRTLSSVALLIAFTGCPKPTTTTTGTTTPDPTTGEAKAAFGDTMADAPLYHVGSTVKGLAGCSTSGYAKFDIPAGQAAKMTATVEGPPGTCLSVHYLKANGGAVDGMMKEMCVDKAATETWDIQGQEGGSFIQMSENPPCKNATLTISVQ